MHEPQTRILPSFPIPLQKGPPDGFDVTEAKEGGSGKSKISSFQAGLQHRDRFNGVPACIICGDGAERNLCHIIPKTDTDTWATLISNHWIPESAKREPANEPRNGITMCPNHHAKFDKYKFFIRFSPEDNKYILINYSEDYNLKPFHKKAVALDKKEFFSPFPSLFYIHELRVRAHHPFQLPDVVLPTTVTYQDWIPLNSLRSSFDRSQPIRIPSTETQEAEAGPSHQPVTSFTGTQEAEAGPSRQPIAPSTGTQEDNTGPSHQPVAPLTGTQLAQSATEAPPGADSGRHSRRLKREEPEFAKEILEHVLKIRRL